MTTEEKVRGLCRALLAAQNEDELAKLLPRLAELKREYEEKLEHGKRPAKANGHDITARVGRS